MTSHADLVASCVLREFDKLPPKRKPAVRDNGLHEWVALAGIVAEIDGRFICLALATGVKCLPAAAVPESNGVGLHDCHAEILAIRTFNRFLVDECLRVLNGDRESEVLTQPRGGPHLFHIRDRVTLHLYCSEAPCGDASMELVMAAQGDDTPWFVPHVAVPSEVSLLAGRAYFSRLGIVRRKPARRDAPPTLSKSCSDKLSLKQCTSLLSSLASLFVSPEHAYISSLVLPESQFCPGACRRAFSDQGRMGPLLGRHWGLHYSFKPFFVETTTLEFVFSKRGVGKTLETLVASSLATAWSLRGVEETLVNGVVRGRRAFDPRGASRMSRRQMWQAACVLAGQRDVPSDLKQQLFVKTYQEAKGGPLLATRRQVKADAYALALTGWVKNDGGSQFSIDFVH